MAKTPECTTGLAFEEPLIFARSRPGKVGFDVDAPDVPEVDPAALFGADNVRTTIPGLPEVSEPEVVRHYTRLSQWNYCIDTGFYPLGSCTMKYNPKVNEAVSRFEGFTRLHPAMPEQWTQGALALLYSLEQILCEIGGLAHCSLQPAAGAQGELAGLLCIRAYHRDLGERDRDRILVPDSAHGTNPASATLAGLRSVELKANEHGIIDPAAVEALADDRLAGVMITNPNTFGLFETNIVEICDIVHKAGGLVYCDGANMNSILGRTRPGDWGVDVMHYNLHKTLSTPHGGGGPGAGPICVNEKLEPFLPVPRVRRTDEGRYYWDHALPKSIGKLRTFYGQFLVLVRAYAYLRSLGEAGLKGIADRAVLNANYLRVHLQSLFEIAFDQPCMHECIFTEKGLGDVKTLDVAKRLIDYGYHPPTMYFPISVKGALMVEPTESESKQTLDHFIAAMRTIRTEIDEEPEILKAAPSRAFRSRLDETRAARKPVLTAFDIED